MANANMAIWITDVHAAASSADPFFVYSLPEYQHALAAHLAGLDAALMILTGDCAHHYGLQADHNSFRDDTYNRLSPRPYVVRGNHDEVQDVGAGTATDFSMFDSTFPDLPYHWTADWTAPKIRFLGFHSYIHHTDPYQGFATADASEITWLTTQLAALPAGWKAILCTHFPLLDSVGNNIHSGYGQEGLLALFAANNTKIAAYLCGHKHYDCPSTTQDGILHIVGGAAAYTNGQGFMLLEYRPGTNDIKVHYRSVVAGAYFGEKPLATYTPLVIAL